jgi:hypothetical protein
MTQLYGPAVRCKLNLLSGSDWSCSSVSGPFVEQIAPGHHGFPRASDLILGKALEGQSGHQITDATARPFPISSKSNAQTSAGISSPQADPKNN